MKKRILLAALAVLLLILAGIAIYFVRHPMVHVPPNDIQVRKVVVGFGDEISQVRFTESAASTTETLREHYSLYVRPDLLDSWIANPSTAPGRRDGIWPDRAEIQKVIKSAEGTYTVEAWIITKGKNYSSTAPTTWFPATFTVSQGPDGWQISQYVAGAITS